MAEKSRREGIRVTYDELLAVADRPLPQPHVPSGLRLHDLVEGLQHPLRVVAPRAPRGGRMTGQLGYQRRGWPLAGGDTGTVVKIRSFCTFYPHQS